MQKWSWSWPVEFAAMSCEKLLYSPQGNETKNQPNRWPKAGSKWDFVSLHQSTEGKKELIFSSQLLPLLFLKLHLITKAGSKEGTGREKPGKREVAKLTRAEFQGVKWWAWDCSTCRLLRSPLPFCPLGWSPWYDSSLLFLHTSFYPPANTSW